MWSPFFWLSISLVADAGLWLDESTREESVDGFFGLIDGDAGVWGKVIEHPATFRGVNRQPQFFGLAGDEVYVTDDDEAQTSKVSLKTRSKNITQLPHHTSDAPFPGPSQDSYKRRLKEPL